MTGGLLSSIEESKDAYWDNLTPCSKNLNALKNMEWFFYNSLAILLNEI